MLGSILSLYFETVLIIFIIKSSSKEPNIELGYMNSDDMESIGSNNWVIHGSRTASEYPMMANDPHRVQAVPSLRYMSHLVGPGWNVIGGGDWAPYRIIPDCVRSWSKNEKPELRSKH